MNTFNNLVTQFLQAENSNTHQVFTLSENLFMLRRASALIVGKGTAAIGTEKKKNKVSIQSNRANENKQKSFEALLSYE